MIRSSSNRRPRRAPLAALVLAGTLGGGAVAQDGLTGRTAVDEPIWPERPFGAVFTAESMVESQRIALDDRAVRQFGNRTLVPPRHRRTGFVPRVGAGVEYNDNLFLTPADRTADSSAYVSPGVNFVAESARGRLEADGSIEAVAYRDNSDLNNAVEAGTVFIDGRYAATPRTGVQWLQSFLSSEDPSGELVPAGTTGERFRIDRSFVQGAADHRLDATGDVRIVAANTLFSSENPTAVSSMYWDGDAGYARRLDRRLRTGARYRVRHFEFGAGYPDATYHAGLVEAEYELSRRTVVRGVAGIAVPNGGDASSEPVGRLNLTHALRNGVVGAGFERDVIATGGVGYVLRQTAVYGSASWRPARAVTLTGTLALQRLDSLGPTPLEVRILEPRLSSIWNLGGRAALALRYRYVRRDTNFDATLVRQGVVDLSVVASF